MKTCGRCCRLKPIVEFSFRSKARGTRQSICVVCFAEYRRQHYRNNKAEYIKRNNRNIRIRAKALNRWLFDFLTAHP